MLLIIINKIYCNINLIIDSFSATKSQTGLISTMFFISYGAGQIINGLLCKFYPKKYVLSIAMVVSAGLNLAIFFGASFESMKWLWLVNGFSQSFLWSSLVLVMSECLDKKALKKAIFVMSTTATVGTLLTYGFSALFSMTRNYKYSFALGGFLMIIITIIWFFTYDSLYEKRQVETEVVEKESCKINRAEKSAKESVQFIVIISMIFLGIFAVANNLVKDGLQTWVPTVLKEEFGFSDGISLSLTRVVFVMFLSQSKVII